MGGRKEDQTKLCCQLLGYNMEGNIAAYWKDRMYEGCHHNSGSNQRKNNTKTARRPYLN